MTLAEMMAKSDLVPKDYKLKPGNIIIAVQMGAEIGLQPMQAIQGIAVINGKPAVYGDAGKGLLLANGCTIEEDDIELIKKNKRARCKISRKGRPPVERTFSEENAKVAKLWQKEGPWTNYPERQMAWRAFWFAARDAASDILKGLAGAEELMDYTPEKDVTPQRATDRVEAQVANAAKTARGETIDTSTGEILDGAGTQVKRSAQDIMVDIEAADVADVMTNLKEEIIALPKGPEKVAAGKAWEARLKVLKEAIKQGTPTVDDAIAAVRNGDYDTAADLARSLPEKDRLLIEAEIKDAKEKPGAEVT